MMVPLKLVQMMNGGKHVRFLVYFGHSYMGIKFYSFMLYF